MKSMHTEMFILKDGLHEKFLSNSVKSAVKVCGDEGKMISKY